MQRSDHIKRILKALLFVIIFIMIMIIFDAAFLMDEGVTEDMLADYSVKTGIETVFVGNSAGEMLDADSYSMMTGECAFNMCTPSQSLSVSLGNIKLASSQHHVKKAVLLMTFDTVGPEDYDAVEHLYYRVVNSSSPYHKRITGTIRNNMKQSFSRDVVNTESSLNIWIPWENETVHGLSNVSNALKKRVSRVISGDRLGKDIAYDLNTVIYPTVPDDMDADETNLLENDIGLVSELGIPQGLLADDKLTDLARICSYCSNNDIDLTVMITPHRSDYYDRYDSFLENVTIADSYLDQFVSKRGFMYYNTEEDEELHVKLPDEYFYDWEHVSGEYVDRSTEYLTGIIQMLE